MSRLKTRKKGFVIIAVALVLAGLVGGLALSYDLGRVYIARSEVQNFTDAAALAATMELDGTSEGIQRARNRVAADSNRWNFGHAVFQSYVTEFAQEKEGPWDPNPLNPARYKLARVRANVPVPLSFMPALNSGGGGISGGGPTAFLLFTVGSTMNVHGASDAGQEPLNGLRHGLLPFSPFAHDPNTGPHFGLLPGKLYTLRWGANFNSNGNNDSMICPGDRTPAMRELARSGSASDRGFIEENSSSVIRAAIVYDYQTIFRSIGDSVIMTGGGKQAQSDALIARINQDTDSNAATYAEYEGNGRRLVGVPINSGFPDFRIVQIGAFLLLPPKEYNGGGNHPFCAEYVGAWVQGSNQKGVEESGAYSTRLVR